MSFRWSADWDCGQHPHERSARVAVILSASVATVYGLNILRQRWNRAKKVEQKRRECRDAKDNLQRHLDDTRSGERPPGEITDLSFEDLRTKLQSGDLDPVTVLRAYQRKALAVDQRLNCVVEPISEAEDWAKDCKAGPLYGIPVSLKDIVPIKGYGMTFGGCVNALGMTHPMDSAIVTVLKKRGAVPFLITNVPQTLLSFACTNPIFGFTGNPYNPDRTPGGSSGGEAALIGARGSILGVGTDLGGSVRVPAAFCGICSFKPTCDRSSDLGFLPAWNIVRPANGPLARDVETLVEYMRATCSPDLFELDPATTPVPFREEIYTAKGPLRVGFYCDDGYYQPIPAYHRAIDEVKVILEKLGHTVVPFQVPDVGYALEDLFLPAIFGDSGAMLKFILDGDEVTPDLVVPFWTLHLPRPARRLLAWMWSLCDRTQGAVVRSLCGVRSISDWWKLTGAIQTYRTRVIAAWQGAGLDCLLCPPSASVALPDRVTAKLGVFYSYSALYNLLDFPAGVVPVTRVTPDDVTKLGDYVPQTYGQKLLKKAMVGSEGLPVGVQCVALSFQDEVALRLMKAVETGVRQA